MACCVEKKKEKEFYQNFDKRSQLIIAIMTEGKEGLSTTAEIDTQSNVDIDEEVKEINSKRFRMLCDNVQNCFYHIDNSMFEMLELKDKLLLQYLPPNVLLQITIVFSRFYRAYSQSQVPVYELIRLVQLYSEPFDKKCVVLKTLYDSNEIKKRMLNMAFQRLTSMENNLQQYEEQKCINNWEKMYIRRVLPRSNARKWKFRITTFREKAKLGYEHVMDWLGIRLHRPSTTLQILSNAELIDDQDDIQLEITNEQNVRIDQTSDYNNEIKSVVSHIEEQKQPEQESIVTNVDVEIQAQPDFYDQQTSTEDILSTKLLIMRIYRPIEILKTKFQCIIHAQGEKYMTNIFQKPNNENIKNKGRLIAKRIESSTVPDKIDKQQTDELLIPMSSFLKRSSLFQTDTDPDAIKIDILGDEKLCGSLIFTSEDLRMLDLPNLYSSLILDDNVPTNNNQFDFDQPSNEIYKSWISHTPQTFSIYNDKYESIGKLPLLMFWYTKTENTHATKSTMTDPMETRESTSKIISSIDIKITNERRSSEIPDDNIEIVKTAYENEIATLLENYQAEICRLTNLLNETLSRQSTQMNDENTPEMIEKDLSITRQRQSAPVYGRNLPKNFLDRSQLYLQRSITNRNQLIAKVEQETALANERQMEFQHRLYKPQENTNESDDLCLPAVFMPFRSGNVFNPRAYQFFHSVGSNNPRLTQPPSILKFPSLPSRSVSVLNLFELSRAYDNTNEKDRFIEKKS